MTEGCTGRHTAGTTLMGRAALATLAAVMALSIPAATAAARPPAAATGTGQSQAAARQLLFEALTIVDEISGSAAGGDDAGVSAASLAAADPLHTYVGPSQAAATPGTVSVGTDAGAYGTPVAVLAVATTSARGTVTGCAFLATVQGKASPFPALGAGLWFAATTGSATPCAAGAAPTTTSSWTRHLGAVVSGDLADDATAIGNVSHAMATLEDAYYQPGQSFAGVLAYLQQNPLPPYQWVDGTTPSTGADVASLAVVSLESAGDDQGLVTTVESASQVCWSSFQLEQTPSPPVDGITTAGLFVTARFVAPSDCTASQVLQTAPSWFTGVAGRPSPVGPDVLEHALDVADELYPSSASYAGATPAGLAAADPTLTYVPATTAAGGTRTVSVETYAGGPDGAPTVVDLAAETGGGRCGWLAGVQSPSASFMDLGTGLWFAEGAPPTCDAAAAPTTASAWSSDLPALVADDLAADRAAQSDLTNAVTEASAVYQADGQTFDRILAELRKDAPEFTWLGATTPSDGLGALSLDAVSLRSPGDDQGLVITGRSRTLACWSVFVLEQAPAPPINGITVPGLYVAPLFYSPDHCSAAHALGATSEWFAGFPVTPGS